MNAKQLDELATMVVDCMKRAIAPRDERISVLEQRLSDLEGRLALDQRLKTIEQRIERWPRAGVSASVDPNDISDLIQ